MKQNKLTTIRSSISFVSVIGLLLLPVTIITKAGPGPILSGDLALFVLVVPVGLSATLFDLRIFASGLFGIRLPSSAEKNRAIAKMLRVVSIITWLVTSLVVIASLLSLVINLGGDSYLIGRSVRFALVSSIYALVFTGFWIMPREYAVIQSRTNTHSQEVKMETTNNRYTRMIRVIIWLMLVAGLLIGLPIALETSLIGLLWLPEVAFFVVAVPIILTFVMTGRIKTGLFSSDSGMNSRQDRAELRPALLLLMKVTWICGAFMMLVSIVGMFANIGGDPTLIGTNLQRAFVSPFFAIAFTGLFVFPLTIYTNNS
ncbi:MAG: hypothetical protein PF508_16835 [Spirochaeta sp.]|nr:hypothetical protein [Spirochaeta sp.]